MPKLLQFDSCLGILSTGKISEGIAKVAMSQGWECHIMHGARYVGSTVQQHYQVSSRWEEYIHYTRSYLFDSHGLGSHHATKRIIKQIQEIKPNVIQLHCIHGYYLNYRDLFNYLIRSGIPVVWTFHDCWAFTGHCSHFSTIGCEKWQTGCNNCPQKNGYPKSLFIDQSARNWKLKRELFKKVKDLTIVSVSKWLDQLVTKSFLSKKRHICIYSGIDTQTFKFRISNIREKFQLENKFVILAAATAWSPSKGLMDYIELSKHLEDDEQLVLIGLTENLRKNLPSNILGLPRSNNAIELAEWYSASDIVLNLSYQETFGLTTVEAMSCGTPGIVYNCTASPELITSGTGLIVEPGNINDVRGAISKIRNDNIVRPEKCRNRVLSNFEMYSQYDKYIELYDNLLNNR